MAEYPETRITDDGTVRIPTTVRERLGVEPGDRLRWRVTDDDQLRVEIVRQEYGAFEDAPSANLGGDSLDSYDAAGYESDERE